MIAASFFVAGDRVPEEGGGEVGPEVEMEEHAGRLWPLLDRVVLAIHQSVARGKDPRISTSSLS